VRFESERRVRDDVGRPNGLIESQRNHHRAVVALVLSIPVEGEEFDGRRRKRETVRRGQTTSADGDGGRVDGDVVLRRVRQLSRGIRRKDQDRRAGPTERAGDGGTNGDERCGNRIGNAAQNHHRFREHDPDFIRLAKALNLVCGPALNNGQRCRLLRGGASR
jgi:hypothetical protein